MLQALLAEVTDCAAIARRCRRYDRDEARCAIEAGILRDGEGPTDPRHAEMSHVSKLKEGSWSARWGAWFVRIQKQPSGWRATVWRWEPGEPLSARREIAATTALEAAQWAGVVMLDDGATVMVLDVPVDLVFASVLDFSPAPEVV